MYEPDIFDGIVKILADRENIVDSLTYTALYNELTRNLGRTMQMKIQKRSLQVLGRFEYLKIHKVIIQLDSTSLIHLLYYIPIAISIPIRGMV